MGKKPEQKLPTLDLHGRQTDEVYDLLDNFITRQVDNGTSRVRVMPGKGSGKVKAVVQDYLKRAHYPWQFERLSNGQQNEGVMVVFLD
ncbi:MAG: Smr/MutS family protein [Bdellovibrionales bacterium]